LGFYLAGKKENTWLGLAWAWLLFLPAVVILSGILYSILIIDGGKNPFLTILFLSLFLPLLTPWLGFLMEQKKRILSLSAVLVLGLFFSGIFLWQPSKEKPIKENILFGFDQDQSRAFWLSWGVEDSPWLKELFGPDPVEGLRPEFFSSEKKVFYREIKNFSLPSPEVLLLGDQRVDDLRRIRFRVRSRRDARCLILWEPTGVRFQGTRVDGQSVREIVRFGPKIDFWLAKVFFPKSKAQWKIYFCNPPSEGIEISLETSTQKPLLFKIVDESDGIPKEMLDLLPVRPDHVISYPGRGRSLASRSWTVPND